MDWANLLKERLQQSLPGEWAQNLMTPNGRHPTAFIQRENPGDAAVLVLIYPIHHILHTVLMLRPSYDGAHANQISFPGGKVETTDNSFEIAALREGFEEINVDPQLVQVIGHLTPLYIPVSNFNVHPVVGICTSQPAYTLNPKEVEQIIELPLTALLNEDNVQLGHFYLKLLEKEYEMPYFKFGAYRIWGATAMILSELKQILKSNANAFSFNVS